MLYQIAWVLNPGETAPNNTSTLFLNAFAYVIFYPLIPRFIISVREIYDRDVRGRSQEIDTGFGVLSQSFAAPDTSVSVMVFLDDSPGCQHPAALESGADELDAMTLASVVRECTSQV